MQKIKTAESIYKANQATTLLLSAFIFTAYPITKIIKMEKAVKTNETILTDSSRNIIMHHLGSFKNNDLEAVIDDYTSESVLITQDTTYTGPEEIKSFFSELMIHFPKQKSSFELDKLIVNNELAYIVWHATTPTLNVAFGTDTFIIREGKIYQQTFAGQMKFTEQ